MSFVEFIKRLKAISKNKSLTISEQCLVEAAWETLKKNDITIKELKKEIEILKLNQKPTKRILIADQGHSKRK